MLCAFSFLPCFFFFFFLNLSEIKNCIWNTASKSSGLQQEILCLPASQIVFWRKQQSTSWQNYSFYIHLGLGSSLYRKPLKKYIPASRFSFFCKQVAQRRPAMDLMDNIHSLGIPPSLRGKNSWISRVICCSWRAKIPKLCGAPFLPLRYMVMAF